MANRRCRLFHVDAFTRQRFGGNPAAVVLDADDLSDEEMLTIAAEVNAETAFVLSAESNDFTATAINKSHHPAWQTALPFAAWLTPTL